MFVVWEPVIATDWVAPGRRTLARITDRRATQFWDRPRLLSGKILEAARANPAAVLGRQRLEGDLENSIVWDFVGVYPPGVRWDQSFPVAKYAGAPVVRVIDEVRRNL